jgi:hypothetical protein
VTYGEHSRLLREALGALLRQHRIQQRIGGAGIYTVPVSNTHEERERLGHLIRRYRRGVLTWTEQAAEVAAPRLALGDFGRPAQRRPADILRHRLKQTLEHHEAPLAPMELLTTPQPFDLVDRWRVAARAAALGEHDFPALRQQPNFDGSGALDVLHDAAEVVLGLVMLDRRYRDIPGWQPLFGRGDLQHAATRATDFAQRPDSRHLVDTLGWRPPLTPIPGPARTGFEGVIQAEHNLLIRLDRFPTALNLKRILDSQRELSHRLSLRILDTDPALGDKWRTRARTYHWVFAEARNLGGLVGDGSAAAAEGAFAVDRLRHLTADAVPTAEQLCRLDHLWEQLDHRIADMIERGAHHRLYFTKAEVPELDPDDGHLVHGPRATFLPITSPVQTAVLELAREHLRPPPIRPAPLPGAAQGRADFRAALVHSPGQGEVSTPAPRSPHHRAAADVLPEVPGAQRSAVPSI